MWTLLINGIRYRVQTFGGIVSLMIDIHLNNKNLNSTSITCVQTYPMNGIDMMLIRFEQSLLNMKTKEGPVQGIAVPILDLKDLCRQWEYPSFTMFDISISPLCYALFEWQEKTCQYNPLFFSKNHPYSPFQVEVPKPHYYHPSFD